jgi:copper chaperone CopZ
MNSLKKTVITIVLLLSVVVSNAQIKNAKTATVKIFGSCDICKTFIEKAGNLKKLASVDWNKDTKMATITYDAKKTNEDEILKRIALAGYDNAKFLAPEDAYNKLSDCCLYDRELKTAVKTDMETMPNHSENDIHSDITDKKQKTASPLKPIFDNYFLLKDALVKTDAEMASMKAKDLLTAISTLKMEDLKMEEHMVWMKMMKELTNDIKNISETQDIKRQRDLFKSVTQNTYELMKVSKSETPTYYQYCPMQDAYWLSKENVVKNPYYGSMMLSCGKTVETIK